MNILEHSDIKIDMKHVRIISNFYIYNNSFLCHDYGLTSLYGSPILVNGDFYCHKNKLTSLEHCPIEVRGWFSCAGNYLTSLENCPKYVKGNFYCGYNKVKFTEEYVRSLCEVGGEIFC